MVRLSQISNRRIFTTTSSNIGTASDVLIDPAEGKVKFLVKNNINSIMNISKEQAKQFLKDNLIPIEKLQAVGNVIMIRD